MNNTKLTLSKNDEWYTPINIVQHFGEFDYDPATTDEKAREFNIPNFDTIYTDGLKREWKQFKRIWCNPPFSLKFEFLKKAFETSEDSDTKIFFLLPIDALTTKKFYNLACGKDYAIYLPNGRINFENNGVNNKRPSFGSVILELNTDRWISHFELTCGCNNSERSERIKMDDLEQAARRTCQEDS